MVGTGTESFRAEVRNRATQTPLEDLDPGHWDYFEFGVAPKVLGRLRREAPVHRCERSAKGPYWSITRFEDVRSIELDPARLSAVHADSRYRLSASRFRPRAQSSNPCSTDFANAFIMAETASP